LKRKQDVVPLTNQEAEQTAHAIQDLSTTLIFLLKEQKGIL
jgi:hypothetical protein